MGLFSKDPDKVAAQQEMASAKAREQVEKAQVKGKGHDEKARAKAVKKGVAVDGAIAVGHSWLDGMNQFLIVFPDRVQRIGGGNEVIPMSRISSVETAREGNFSVLEVHTSGNTLKFKGDPFHDSVARLHSVILELMMTSTASSPTSASGAAGVDITDQLRKLGELHQAGIVTDEEFATKKAELLERL